MFRADFIYMAPPFMAYSCALQGGGDAWHLLVQAYDQCRLYRNYLRDDSGLWRHIVLGNYSDDQHWGTGASTSSCAFLGRSPAGNNFSDAAC